MSLRPETATMNRMKLTLSDTPIRRTAKGSGMPSFSPSSMAETAAT